MGALARGADPAVTAMRGTARRCAAAAIATCCFGGALAAPPPMRLASGALALSVDPSDLAMTISVACEPPWLVGSAFMHRSSPSDGGLVPAAPASAYTGSDALGAFHGLNMTWRQNACGPVVWATSIRAYDGGGRIAFRQSLPGGLAVRSSSDGVAGRRLGSAFASSGVTTAFPALMHAPGAPQLGLVSYNGSSAGNMVSYGSFPNDTNPQGEMSGCTVIVPRPAAGAGAPNPTAHALVFSQLDHFFASAVARTSVNGTIAAAAGLMSGFDSAPPGFSSEAVLVLASASEAPLPPTMAGMPPGGINHAAQKWGDTLLAYHGVRSRAAVSGPTASVRAQYFGYSTTAFYHHNPCDPSNGNLDTSTCKSWEATLCVLYRNKSRVFQSGMCALYQGKLWTKPSTGMTTSSSLGGGKQG